VEDEALEDMGGPCYKEEMGIRLRERRGGARREPAGQGGVGGSIEGRKRKKAKSN